MLDLMKASAGSGKTYSLARQYISLLLKSEDRYAYRHILAVTFTNKATDEMKGRILKELHVMATAPQDSDYRDYFIPSVFKSEDAMQEKAKRVLQDILHDYSAFAVSTIDRFFQQTLKAFSREIGHFASYQVELDKDSLVAESVDRILDSLTEEQGGLLLWLTRNVLEQIEQGGRYSMDANLKDMALRLMSTQRQDALDQFDGDKDGLCSQERLMNIRTKCRELADEFRTEVRKRARAVLDVLRAAGVDPAESNRKFMNALYVYDGLSDTDKIEIPKETFFTRASDPEQWFAKARKSVLLPKVAHTLWQPLQDFCALWGKDFAIYNTACILDGQLYGLGVASELFKTFNELMKEKNVLCIDDSNVLLNNIIDKTEAPFVYEKLGVRYEHFLLDEFQDTSRVQWENFSPLLKNSESQGGENLIVGDVKQSIYRWRGSDWKLLDQKIPQEFDGCKETVLDTNYRSLSNIVDFNNGFFKEAALVLDRMSGCKADGPMEGIYADVEQKVAKKDKPGGGVKLTFCDPESELYAVLESVRTAQEAGAKLSEIAVLVRSNAAGQDVATFLIDNGISVVTDDSLKVKNSLTVRRLVSLMSYVDNPQDTVAGYLAGLLDIRLPDSCGSLIDMAEYLYRSLQKSDEENLWQGELLYIQSFMDCLSDYVASEGNSLRGFLRWWNEKDPSISSPSSGDSVRVMTIHKSKGLDFPYVILPFVEKISLYKADSHWCIPALEGTPLQGVADGVYDVHLSSSSAATLFSEDYRKELFLQYVDNINTLYVAMTRAALGMHIIARRPPAKLVEAMDDGQMPQFSDFSQILYWYASGHQLEQLLTKTVGDDTETFEKGTMADFASLRKNAGEVAAMKIAEGCEFPSIPLNPAAGDDGEDVRVRGRLKFSADSLDFFKEDEAGVKASVRVRGIVLHDILAGVKVPSDLMGAVEYAVQTGVLTTEESEEAAALLEKAISEVESYGWFAACPDALYNEVSLIDTDGQIYRPDRVVVREGKVDIIDYKFGEHRPQYERQVSRYMKIWKRMGYPSVSGYLWYVDSGEIVRI